MKIEEKKEKALLRKLKKGRQESAKLQKQYENIKDKLSEDQRKRFKAFE